MEQADVQGCGSDDQKPPKGDVAQIQQRAGPSGCTADAGRLHLSLADPIRGSGQHSVIDLLGASAGASVLSDAAHLYDPAANGGPAPNRIRPACARRFGQTIQARHFTPPCPATRRSWT